MGLLGHSDADVAAHALMDALLGAAGLGDIGKLFPDSDDKYLGVSSMALLEDVAARVAALGYTLCNADITIIAERPKLSKYTEDMRKTLAAHLNVPPDSLNVKATTEEGLGRASSEGIAAHAVALLEGPGPRVRNL